MCMINSEVPDSEDRKGVDPAAGNEGLCLPVPLLGVHKKGAEVVSSRLYILHILWPRSDLTRKMHHEQGQAKLCQGELISCWPQEICV